MTGSYDGAFLFFLVTLLPAVIAVRWLPDSAKPSNLVSEID
jgi:hypothetical protein